MPPAFDTTPPHHLIGRSDYPMGKGQNQRKETKKKPAKTLAERRAEKRAKKQA